MKPNLTELEDSYNSLLKVDPVFPTWKSNVTIQFTNKFGNPELVGKEVKLSKFMVDLLESFPSILQTIRCYEKSINKIRNIRCYGSCDHQENGECSYCGDVAEDYWSSKRNAILEHLDKKLSEIE